MPDTIIFIRHGETDWNKQGLIQGSIDTDLNETGRAQAAHLAQLMLAKAEMLEGFQIICSPQRRAQQTAEAILKALGRDLDATDHRVKELGLWHLGRQALLGAESLTGLPRAPGRPLLTGGPNWVKAMKTAWPA